MATHSSILAWRIPWTEEPTGYSPWGHKESDMMGQNSQQRAEAGLGKYVTPTQPHPSCLALLLNPPCHPGSMNSPAFSMPETDLPVPEFPIIQFQPLEILFPYPVSLIAIF